MNEKGNMDVAILTPSYGQLPGSYLDCFHKVLFNALACQIHLIKPDGVSCVTQARNICMQKLLMEEEEHKRKFDYVFWIDSDIIYSSWQWETLIFNLRCDNHDALSGVYFTKRTNKQK